MGVAAEENAPKSTSPRVTALVFSTAGDARHDIPDLTIWQVKALDQLDDSSHSDLRFRKLPK